MPKLKVKVKSSGSLFTQSTKPAFQVEFDLKFNYVGVINSGAGQANSCSSIFRFDFISHYLIKCCGNIVG